jgi:hypothetical protein
MCFFQIKITGAEVSKTISDKTHQNIWNKNNFQSKLNLKWMKSKAVKSERNVNNSWCCCSSCRFSSRRSEMSKAGYYPSHHLHHCCPLQSIRHYVLATAITRHTFALIRENMLYKTLFRKFSQNTTCVHDRRAPAAPQQATGNRMTYL